MKDGAYSARAGTKISRWPLLLMELTKPAGEIMSKLTVRIDLVKPAPELLNSRATNVKEINKRTANTVLSRVESLTAKSADLPG